MNPYVFKRNKEGIHIVNVAKTWEKLMLAARVIAAIPNPRDVLVSLFPHFELRVNMAFLHLSSMEGRWGVRLPLDRFQQRLRSKSHP